MVCGHVVQLKFVAALPGCLSLLTCAREIFRGGVKTRPVERNCNLIRQTIPGSEEQISY